MKWIFFTLCAAALAVGIAACGNQETVYPDSILTGQVQSVAKSTVTMLLGDLTTEMTNVGSAETGETPFEMGGMTTVFTAGEETVTLTVSEDAAKILADLKPGDLLQAETDADGKAVTLSVIELIP